MTPEQNGKHHQKSDLESEGGNVETQDDNVKPEGDESAEAADMESGTASGECLAPQRLGDVGQCPVCGSDVNAEAYQCPTCRSLFCFHCRARVLPGDTQLQCVNQECSYYGKLICDVCEEKVVEEQPPAVYMEPEEGFWPLLLLALLIVSTFVWTQTSFGWALLCLILGFPLLGTVLHLWGLNMFGRERRVEHRRTEKNHRCICCQKTVKQLSTSTIMNAGWTHPGSPV